MEENLECLSFQEKLKRMERLCTEASSYFPQAKDKKSGQNKRPPATQTKTKIHSQPVVNMEDRMELDPSGLNIDNDNVNTSTKCNQKMSLETKSKTNDTRQWNQDNVESVSYQSDENKKDLSAQEMMHTEKNNANNNSHQHSTHGGKDLHSPYTALEDKVRRKEKEMLKPNNNTDKEIIYENISTDRSYDMYGNVQQTNLLLLGKTGNGKSSLGNSILGHDAFESKPSMDSVTKNVMFDFTETHGERFKVVDTPGVGDTRADSVEGTRLVLTAMSKAISLSPQGYHAFLLVVKFGGRFTEEDRQTVITLKKIFGELFFKKYFIIVMTCGDKFEEEVQTTFNGWVQEQNNGIFGELLNECNNRIVLFNNITKDKAKRKNQLNVLLNVIRDLKQQNCCYSDEHFNAALTTRNILLVESNKKLIEEEIMVEAHLILQRLQLILDTVEVQHRAPFLNDILPRANALYEKINEKDQRTGVMYDLNLHMWSVISSITDELNLSECMKEKMDGFEMKRKEDAKVMAEELRYQREIFEKYFQEGLEREEKKIEMLQKQIDIMNEKGEQWRNEKEELESKLKAFMGGQKEKVRMTKEKVKKLKDQQAQYSEKKMSKGVFTKLARVIRLKKEEDEYNEIDC